MNFGDYFYSVAVLDESTTYHRNLFDAIRYATKKHGVDHFKHQRRLLRSNGHSYMQHAAATMTMAQIGEFRKAMTRNTHESAMDGCDVNGRVSLVIKALPLQPVTRGESYAVSNAAS